MKNGEPLEFELVQESAKILDPYLRAYRPLLLDEPSGWLFPGKYGHIQGKTPADAAFPLANGQSLISERGLQPSKRAMS